MDNKKSTDDINQGFNDAELADIMNEIEDLERDLKAQGETEPESVVQEVSSPHMNDVLEEFVSEPVEKVLPFTNKSPVVASMKNDIKSTTQSSMDFTVAGNMTINLSFNVSGQTINLSLDEAQGLVIEMKGGAKFCLPLNAIADTKKKAS